MKKLIPILVIAVAVLASSCEKLTMERSTIAIVAQDVRVDIIRAHDTKYLYDWYGPDEILDLYLDRLEMELNHGKLELVQFEEDADYTIELRSIQVEESIRTFTCAGAGWDELVFESTVTTNGALNLFDNSDGELLRSMDLTDTETDDERNDGCGVDGFGGIGVSFENHARMVRKRIKWAIRATD